MQIQRFQEMIFEEFSQTKMMLKLLFGQELSERRPRMHKTLQLRAEGLRMLHRQQVSLLRQWRELGEDCTKREEMLPQLLLSVNAIASGLRTTG